MNLYLNKLENDLISGSRQHIIDGSARAGKTTLMLQRLYMLHCYSIMAKMETKSFITRFSINYLTL